MEEQRAKSFLPGKRFPPRIHRPEPGHMLLRTTGKSGQVFQLASQTNKIRILLLRNRKKMDAGRRPAVPATVMKTSITERKAKCIEASGSAGSRASKNGGWW